ncbi:MAG: FkbM family methyltransferase [Myxococcales bacterium]|nr:MAG: FkbM family methyltransferase [Myxococcales bacterium]
MKQKTITVSCVTLDSFFEGKQLAKPYMVKFDVQGYELMAIKGGSELLSGAELCLVEVSVAPLYEGQATFSEIVIELERVGLLYSGNVSQQFTPDGRIAYFDALFARNYPTRSQSID